MVNIGLSLRNESIIELFDERGFTVTSSHFIMDNNFHVEFEHDADELAYVLQYGTTISFQECRDFIHAKLPKQLADNYDN